MSRPTQTQRAPRPTGAPAASSGSRVPIDAPVLSVDDVAARLKLSKAAVYELTRFRQASDTPRLPARKIGKCLRFVAAEIDAWLLALPQHRHLQKRQYIRQEHAG